MTLLYQPPQDLSGNLKWMSHCVQPLQWWRAVRGLACAFQKSCHVQGQKAFLPFPISGSRKCESLMGNDMKDIFLCTFWLFTDNNLKHLITRLCEVFLSSFCTYIDVCMGVCVCVYIHILFFFSQKVQPEHDEIQQALWSWKIFTEIMMGPEHSLA